MARRVPTENQYEALRVLGSGSMIVSGGSRKLRALVNRGWIIASPPDSDNGFRITPDGLRALALAVETYGLPEIKAVPHLEKAPIQRYRGALQRIRHRGCHCAEIANEALEPSSPPKGDAE